MSDTIVVVPFTPSRDEDLLDAKEARACMEAMVVDYLKEWAAGKPMVTISDGHTTIQCVINNPEREQPKRP